MHKLARTLPLLLLFTFALSTSEARADNVVVTSGSLTAPATGNIQFSFAVEGPNFNANLRGADFGVTPQCDNCGVGTTINLRSYYADKFGSGPTVLNGISYDRLFYGGTIEFMGSALINPDAFVSGPEPFFYLTAPFTASGTVNVFTSDPLGAGAPIFTTALSGQGIATVQLFMRSGFDGYFVSRTTYDFQTAPVPEPATMLLLGTGLAGVAAKVRRRGKAQHSNEA